MTRHLFQRIANHRYSAIGRHLRDMALYPRQNLNSCLQHCCFELLLVFTFHYPNSTIQHCLFTIQSAYFKCNVVRTCDILIPCSMCLYGVKCDMLPTQSNILVFCIPKQYPYFALKFLRLTCNIRVFQCNFDARLCVACEQAHLFG